MPGRIRVKPSKPSSLVGMVAGGIFVFVGLFVVVPTFGPFGLIWTLFAIIIAGYHAYNFFSDKGAATWEMDMDTTEPRTRPSAPETDFEAKLRKLNRLKDEGLITEEEFEKKRSEIINQEW